VRGRVLVVEDSADGGSGIQMAVEVEGFGAAVRRSPAAALDDLPLIDPLLAVVDWHVGGRGRVSELLSALAARDPATLVVVVSTRLNDCAVRRAISAAHPGALLHDAQAESDALRLRIRTTVGRPFGDLVIRYGVVVHIPCGRPFRHPVAAKLLAARGRPVLAQRMTAAYLAARRFQSFLELHGSPIRVVAFHSGLRYLADTTAKPACEEAGLKLSVMKSGSIPTSGSRSSPPLPSHPCCPTS
jgi:CheY-like chemotaxis protein